MLTLLIIPNKEYQEDVMRLAKQLGARYEKICYVSLNELYGSLKKTFVRNGIPVQKFFVVDAITRRTDACRKPEGGCVFVSSPNSLIELSLAITGAMRAQGSQLMLFDSVSTLLIYESVDIVTKFMHSLVGKVKEAGADSIFIALQSDINSETVKDLEMFVNETITMDEYNVRNEMKEKATQRTRISQVPKPNPAKRPKLALNPGMIEVGGKPVEVPAKPTLPRPAPVPKPAVPQMHTPAEKPKPAQVPKPVQFPAQRRPTEPAAAVAQAPKPAQPPKKPRAKNGVPQAVRSEEETRSEEEPHGEGEPRGEEENKQYG
ncbi:MAG: ATPase domain-containing protein [Candidatus Diapherotrites archaeon]